MPPTYAATARTADVQAKPESGNEEDDLFKAPRARGGAPPARRSKQQARFAHEQPARGHSVGRGTRGGEGGRAAQPANPIPPRGADAEATAGSGGAPLPRPVADGLQPHSLTHSLTLSLSLSLSLSL